MIPSRRITHGNVKPCSTSVPSTTAKVRKRISDRAGKSGASANAAASETTPRMPAHETTAGICHGGDGSRSRIREDIHRGRYVAGNTQAIRTRITTPTRSAA